MKSTPGKEGMKESFVRQKARRRKCSKAVQGAARKREDCGGAGTLKENWKGPAAWRNER
jgi:hypothetical protein